MPIGEPPDPPCVIAIRMPAIDRAPKLTGLVGAIQTTLRLLPRPGLQWARQGVQATRHRNQQL